jgi:hypothetical protein
MLLIPQTKASNFIFMIIFDTDITFNHLSLQRRLSKNFLYVLMCRYDSLCSYAKTQNSYSPYIHCFYWLISIDDCLTMGTSLLYAL